MTASDEIKKKLGPVRPERKVDRRRKPGLLHGLRKVEVQDVTARMRKPCRQCGVPPEARRLLVSEGSGRAGTNAVYCQKCGGYWLMQRTIEYGRALVFLRLGACEDEKGIRL